MVEAYKLAETEEQKNYLTTELNICRMYLGASLEKGIIKPPEDTDDLIPDL